jgi:hypothetical protein
LRLGYRPYGRVFAFFACHAVPPQSAWA